MVDANGSEIVETTVSTSKAVLGTMWEKEVGRPRMVVGVKVTVVVSVGFKTY